MGDPNKVIQIIVPSVFLSAKFEELAKDLWFQNILLETS